jgi:hypothetical protein
MRRLLFAMVLSALPAFAATNHYVRTDGSDSTCDGSTDEAAGVDSTCAWASPSKCANAGVAVAGSTCWIQPGSYFQQTAMVMTNTGSTSAAIASGCACTNGSTAASCTTGASNFVAGDYFMCDEGYGFYWTRVASQSGNDITLTEAYEGPDQAAGGSTNTASRLYPIAFIGASGTTPTDMPLATLPDPWPASPVIITGFKDEPVDVAWDQVASSCVYSYSTGATADAVWQAPSSIREINGTYAASLASWDLTDSPSTPSGKNGRDSYYKFPTSRNCPCNRGTVLSNVADVPGSFGIDGTTVYAQTYDCVDPDTLNMQASVLPTGTTPNGLFTVSGGADHYIFRGLNLEAPADTDGESGNSGVGLAWLSGSSTNMQAKDLRIEGRMFWQNGTSGSTASATNLTIQNVFASDGFGPTSGTNFSGVKILNNRIRGSHSSSWTPDHFAGASSSDPVIFDGNYIQRTFSDLNDPLCGFGDEWNCSIVPGAQQNNSQWGGHGFYAGQSGAALRQLQNIIIQNNVFEAANESLGYFAGGADTGVIIRFNTFGTGGNAADEYFLTGSTGDDNSALVLYGNVFLRKTSSTGSSNSRAINDYDDSAGVGFTSDYNAWFINSRGSIQPLTQMPWWRFQNAAAGNSTCSGNGSAPAGSCAATGNSSDPANYTMAKMRCCFNQEQHSLIICDSGCAGTGAYNTASPWATWFDDTALAGGTDYTPLTGSPLINAGGDATFLAAGFTCPETDFYGNTRDTLCDLGAVEYQGAAVCGNGVIESGEVCDCGGDACTATELDSETCSTPAGGSHDGGDLSCCDGVADSGACAVSDCSAFDDDACTDADVTAPSAVTDLAASGCTTTTCELDWTTTGNDGATGSFSESGEVEIKWSTSVISAGNYSSATDFTGEDLPIAVTAQEYQATGLPDGTLIYFAMKLIDPAGNASAISNLPSATTVDVDTTDPDPVTDLAVGTPTSTACPLTWHDTGDDGASGTFDSGSTTLVRYRVDDGTGSSGLDSAAEWDVATAVAGVAAPSTAGAARSLTITGLSASTAYDIAVLLRDEEGNPVTLADADLDYATCTTAPVPPSITNPETITGATCEACSMP